jgi:hypothetical protein
MKHPYYVIQLYPSVFVKNLHKDIVFENPYENNEVVYIC